MKLEQIYQRCGLKDPDDYKKEVIDSALFSDNLFYTRSVIEGDRLHGRTTNFMMKAIQDLFEQRSVIIWVEGAEASRRVASIFNYYAELFPELEIKSTKLGEFFSNFQGKSSFLKFVPLYNNIPQSNILGLRWDIEYDDSIEF
jgi:hypothetical protein